MVDRLLRINILIQEKLGQIINREIELPPGTIATITRVTTSDDLKYSTIYISVLPLEQARPVMSILINEVKNLQGLLAGEIDLRSTPRLRFSIDDQEEKAAQLDRLLDNLG